MVFATDLPSPKFKITLVVRGEGTSKQVNKELGPVFNRYLKTDRCICVKFLV